MRQIILFLLVFCKLKSVPEKERCVNCVSATAPLTSHCDESILTSLLAEIEYTCPESIIEQSVTDLETFCKKTHQQLEKFRRYLRTCKVTNDETLYVSLLAGLKAGNKKLCDTTEFIRRFKLYYPCLHELRNDFEGCDAPVDWYEYKDETQICKSYKHVTDCYYIKTAKVCGIEAAQTYKELAMEVINSIIKVKCSAVTKDPNVKDPMPESYLCGQAVHMQSSVNIITSLIFLKVYLIL